LATFFTMTMFVLFIMKSVRGTKLLGALFAFALLAGVAALVSSLFGGTAGAIAFFIGVMVYYANPPVAAFNLILVLGLAGIASAVGFGFSPVALLIVMAILAVYDVVAVYFTRHMVKLAKVMLRRKIFFAMILPESPSGLMTRIAKVNADSGFAFLGTGDLVLPALFAVSVTAAQGLGAAVPVVIGSVAGLLLTNVLFLSQRLRRPMPALPPIVLGSIAGYVFTLLTL
jgi:presenilin-like A22 family membrane protease